MEGLVGLDGIQTKNIGIESVVFSRTTYDKDFSSSGGKGESAK